MIILSDVLLDAVVQQPISDVTDTFLEKVKERGKGQEAPALV